ncbi:TPA: hypothetical protein I0F84_RS06400 [Enterococcus faecalis]|nr:hypothetical protein AUF16_06165 [Enterococcus avium]HAP3021226.1 hypothetical protein [Enterococcus faecalis]HBI1562056.1 hypothetical protein [Enterococcus faecalis]HBI1565115.1 hypothetical protein [Enterococcus faecalis]HBI1717427.1 hypothetical protein [Enterococcus faecalis]
MYINNEGWLCELSETEKITQLLDNLDSEQLDLIIEYIYKLKDLENIKARLDVESENTESFNSVDEWWDSVNED